MDDTRNFPTMIIPAGTDVSVNDQGQLSVRTPGNLVIQNSGTYAVIESTSGSVRIDPEVKVDAVTVQAAESCFVAGELTAWKVRAERIILEKDAQAHIMLQESETLQLDRNARLVGNFASEREMYSLLGRFNRQLRQLSQGLGEGDPPLKVLAGPAVAGEEGDGGDPEAAEQEREETLALARVIVERELSRPDLSTQGRDAMEKLLDLLRTGRVDEVSEGYRYLVSQVKAPSDDLKNARSMLDGIFG